MLYEDQKNGYSIEIPPGWRERQGYFGTLSHVSIFFGLIGDKKHFESGDGKSRLTATAGVNVWPGRLIRKAAMCDFLAFNMFLEIKETDIREIESFRLDGEENTIYIRYESPAGMGRFVSAIRGGKEYTLRTVVERDVFEKERIEEIDAIIGSFRFTD